MNQERLRKAEAYVREWAVQLDWGDGAVSWIFGSHIDHEGRRYAEMVRDYFQVACPLMPTDKKAR